MYNIHQYNNSVRLQQHMRSQEERYAKYLLRHQDYKEKAKDKTKERASSFLQEQHQSPEPFVFEDDHFKRDVEDSTKFVSFKSFRHRPYYDMNKYFNERQRKQIRELSERKQHLVKSKIIPQEQRGRSLRCQGPLNPKIEFRQRKKDHEYLQPRLRFTNITDRQRMNESAMTYDDKFKSLYSSFEMTKSKIGRTIVSPAKKERYRNKSLQFIEDAASSQMAKSKPFFFEKDHSGDDSKPIETASQFINPQLSQRTDSLSPNTRKKMYFKLAKTLHLFSSQETQKERIEQILKRTQYQRRKDLTNIKHNLHGENHIKAPIL